MAARRPRGFDPVPYLQQQRVPGLWLYGGKDESVPVDLSIERLTILRGEGKPFEIELFPKGQHVMWETEDGSRQQLPLVTRFVPGYYETMLRWVPSRSRVVRERAGPSLPATASGRLIAGFFEEDIHTLVTSRPGRSTCPSRWQLVRDHSHGQKRASQAKTIGRGHTPVGGPFRVESRNHQVEPRAESAARHSLFRAWAPNAHLLHGRRLPHAHYGSSRQRHVACLAASTAATLIADSHLHL